MHCDLFRAKQITFRQLLLSTCIELAKVSPQFHHEINLRKLIAVVDLIKEAVLFENSKVLPLVFAYEPSISAMFLAKHTKQLTFCGQLLLLSSTCLCLQSIRNKEKLLAEINQVFSQFMRYSFDLFDEKEEILNLVLWNYYPDSLLSTLNDATAVKEEKLTSHIQYPSATAA